MKHIHIFLVPHRLGLEVPLRLVDCGHPAGGVRLLPALLILRVRQRRLVVQTGRAQAANIFMFNKIFLYFIFNKYSRAARRGHCSVTAAYSQDNVLFNKYSWRL